jgi:hypothetical protein
MAILIALGPPPKRPLFGPSVLQNSIDTLSWPVVVFHRSFCDDLPFPSAPVLESSSLALPVSVSDLPELRILLLRLTLHDLELLSRETLHGYLDRLGSSLEKVLA